MLTLSDYGYMNSPIKHIVSLPVRNKRTPREWLDALSAGTCDQASFFAAIKEYRRTDPDASWEVLSLLDQDYRRGKVGAVFFNSIVSRIQSVALGNDAAADMSAEPPGKAPVNPPVKQPVRAQVTPLRTGATAPISTIIPFNSNESVVNENEEVAASRPTDSAAPAVGKVLRDRYRLIGILGQGGMATVFEAVDQSRADFSFANQRIAIKVLDATPGKQQDRRVELNREFQNLQSLTHPNIVRVYDIDHEGETAFFTMELLNGSLVSEVVDQNNGVALHRSHAIAIIKSVGDAIAYAHSRNIVHGDISPRNIFITDTGEVRVLDFGASHTFTPGQWIAHFDARQSPMATPCFASCQLLLGGTPETSDDVYALACVVYYLYSGKHPFQNRTAIEARTLGLKPTRPTALTSRQWQALRAALSFERADRPANMQTWLQQLGLSSFSGRLPKLPGLVHPKVPVRRFRKRYLLAAVILLSLAVVGFGDLKWLQNFAAQTSTDANQMVLKLRDAWTKEPVEVRSDTYDTSMKKVEIATGRDLHSGAAQTQTDVSEIKISHVTKLSPPVPKAAASAVLNVAMARESQIELTEDAVEVAPIESVAHLMVRRHGNLRSEVTFMWWTESGTAKAGNDFEAVGSHVEHIPVGKDRVNLYIPLVGEAARREARNFYVVIDEPGPGAFLGARTLSMVSILAPE